MGLPFSSVIGSIVVVSIAFSGDRWRLQRQDRQQDSLLKCSATGERGFDRDIVGHPYLACWITTNTTLYPVCGDIIQGQVARLTWIHLYVDALYRVSLVSYKCRLNVQLIIQDVSGVFGGPTQHRRAVAVVPRGTGTKLSIVMVLLLLGFQICETRVTMKSLSYFQ